MNKESSSKKTLLKCKDHLVSGETFALIYDEFYDMLITSPQPQQHILSRYYNSEDYISHTDAKRSLFEKGYHLVKKITLKRKINYINKHYPKRGTLLDIGSGTGDFLKIAKKNGWRVQGIEPNKEASAIAKKKGVSSITDRSSVPSELYDVITLWHVLEHIPDIKTYIKQLKKWLKPGGIIVIAVPNYKSFDAYYYKSYWAAYDVPRHLWHFSKKAIQKLFAYENLELIDNLPMYFDAFYISLLSEKYKTGKMNIFNAIYIGFKSNSRAFFKTKEYASQIYVIRHCT